MENYKHISNAFIIVVLFFSSFALSMEWQGDPPEEEKNSRTGDYPSTTFINSFVSLSNKEIEFLHAVEDNNVKMVKRYMVEGIAKISGKGCDEEELGMRSKVMCSAKVLIVALQIATRNKNNKIIKIIRAGNW